MSSSASSRRKWVGHSVGFFDALMGRTRQVPADLDRLFALPPAGVNLQADLGLVATGKAAVCFKPATGAAFAQVEEDLAAVLNVGGQDSGQWSTTKDEYGYQWVVVGGDGLEEVVTRAHMVNASLQDAGWGPQLLCSAFSFTGDTGPLHLVYLYKRASFYPFAPRPGDKRDNELELRVKASLAADLPIEADLARWFPLWGLPLP